jgi:hypothetical protein
MRVKFTMRAHHHLLGACVAVNYLHNLSIINLDKHLQVVDTGLHEQERKGDEMTYTGNCESCQDYDVLEYGLCGACHTDGEEREQDATVTTWFVIRPDGQAVAGPLDYPAAAELRDWYRKRPAFQYRLESETVHRSRA